MEHDAGKDRIGNQARLAGAHQSPANEQGDQLGVAGRLEARRCMDLLDQLEAARWAIDELIYGFDKLPDDIYPGGELWGRYDDLKQACIEICDAERRWIGS